MKRALLLAVAAALLLSGCGDDSPDETTTTADTTTVRVYFLRDGNVWPVHREVEENQGLPNASFQALLLGPTQDEQDIGFTTEVPENLEDDLSKAALAQLVYTATQFSSVDSAEVKGVNYTRADFEEQTPSVLVESPLPFEEVEMPLRVTGTANTFEANFQYELLDSEGNVVAENFATATSGTGTRGTFDFTTADVEDVATLVVFESSAEDGSRMNEVEIPLTVAP